MRFTHNRARRGPESRWTPVQPTVKCGHDLVGPPGHWIAIKRAASLLPYAQHRTRRAMNGDPLGELDEQGAEIARLRADNDKLRGIIRLQDAAIRSDTATLTSEERMAVAWAVDAASNDEHPAEDILRGLLARSALSTTSRGDA